MSILQFSFDVVDFNIEFVDLKRKKTFDTINYNVSLIAPIDNI